MVFVYYVRVVGRSVKCSCRPHSLPPVAEGSSDDMQQVKLGVCDRVSGSDADAGESRVRDTWLCFSPWLARVRDRRSVGQSAHLLGGLLGGSLLGLGGSLGSSLGLGGLSGLQGSTLLLDGLDDLLLLDEEGADDAKLGDKTRTGRESKIEKDRRW